jgi:DNA-binding GntR family transcriptional regulator
VVVNEISENYDAEIGANLDFGRHVAFAGQQQRSFQKADRGSSAHGRMAASEIVQQLRARIASHALPPGARLREWEVAAEFGVSRLAAREALDILVHLGFVDRQPNRGIVVRRRELVEILRLFDIREVNEGLCARLASSGVPAASWQDLVELFGSSMEDIVERKDLHAYVENYAELRRRLIAAAEAPPLAELLHHLYDLTDIFVRRVLLVSDRAHQGLRDHCAVLQALRAGNAGEAERLRRLTIANLRAAVERYSAFVF